MLTLQQLKDMPPSTAFASGLVLNTPNGIFMTNTNQGKNLLWVAKRGGIHDWAIYIHWATNPLEWVLAHGDKVTTKANIQKLVPCTDEALTMYRF